MSSRQLPGIGLRGFWPEGFDGWKNEMDANLRALSVLVQCRVLSIVNATPANPVNGDVHFFGDTHPTNADSIAFYDNGSWAYIAAFPGLQIFNVADSKRYIFLGGTLVEIVAASSGPSGSGPLAVNNQNASYQPVLGDADNTLIRMNVAAANNLTLPSDATVAFPIGTRINVSQAGAGQTTFVAGANATINVRGGTMKTAGQHGVATAIKVAANTWLLTGDLVA